MSYKVGIIGMVGEEMKKDRWGTLKALSDYGYQGVEGSFLASESVAEMKDNRRRLADLGMETVALSCSQDNPEKLDATIGKAHALGAGLIVTYWGPAENTDQVLKLAETLERMAETCKAAGLAYCYHNHEHEFRPGFGEKGHQCAHELLVANTKTLQFQVDVAWAHFGGEDPVRLLRRIGHRVPAIHVKDLSSDNTRGHFTSVGTGVVNCFGAMEAAAAKGCRWMVVEEDRPNHLTHWESAVASILNIREAGLLLR
jgi:sugar phosphate isomerase/epimerase